VKAVDVAASMWDEETGEPREDPAQTATPIPMPPSLARTPRSAEILSPAGKRWPLTRGETDVLLAALLAERDRMTGLIRQAAAQAEDRRGLLRRRGLLHRLLAILQGGTVEESESTADFRRAVLRAYPNPEGPARSWRKRRRHRSNGTTDEGEPMNHDPKPQPLETP
jgi:hypothetical protein